MSAVILLAFMETFLAMDRKLRAMAAATGAMASISRVSFQLIVDSQTASRPTCRTWLARSETRVTVAEKSCVSEAMRLTILPEGCSS